MDKDEMFAAITVHRLALADQLESLTAEQWNAGSLCAGWRVRDVLAHLITILDLPMRKFVVGVVGMSGFNRRVDRLAREYGQRDPGDLLALYRQLAPKRMAPPFVGPIAPLADLMAHTFDISRPLRLPPIHSADAARHVLNTMCSGFPGFVPKKRIADLEFSTTDLDWSVGHGREVTGTVGDVLLAVTGRTAALEGLVGPGVATLRARLL